MLLALDDTDGPDGGCTTHLSLTVEAALRAAVGEDVVTGPPRLVRLDPLTPHKTRGNAAVVLELADGTDPREALAVAHAVVRRRARVAPAKGAGLAVFARPPDPSWYRRGVRERVPLAEAREHLDRTGTPYACLGTGRGLVGALCAAAWSPETTDPPPTWERIAYRARAAWGTPRSVDAATLARTERELAETFDCVDPATGRAVMVPRTPCPVLYGLRATSPARLAEATERIVSEPVAAARTFITNHASDDHLHPDVLVPLTATDKPHALPGGHVRLPTTTPEGTPRTVMAFEPTGSLRHAVRSVRRGDTVLALGSLTRGPGQRAEPTVHLEKMLHAPCSHPQPTPCPRCGGGMRSTGRDAPRKCRRCGHLAPAPVLRDEPRWWEADVTARRHLARPLALGLAGRVHRAATPLESQDGGSNAVAPGPPAPALWDRDTPEYLSPVRPPHGP